MKRFISLLLLFIFLINILYVSVPSVKASQTYNIPDKQFIHLSLENVSLSPGDIVVPHLWDWYFDGVDDYVYTPIDASERSVFAVEALFKMTHYEDGVPQRPVGEYGTWPISIPKYSTDTCWVGFYDAGDTLHVIHLPESPLDIQGKWVHIYTHFNVSEVVVYRNGEYIGVTTFPNSTIKETLVTRLTKIGTDEQYFFNGSIAFVHIYNRTLLDSEISQNYNQHIINASQLVLFLDPTFYNGTVYKDLSSYGNDGTPYGGVQRVEAENKWLWLVRNGRSDSYIHLMYFPIGSIVRITDLNGNLLLEKTVSSTEDLATVSWSSNVNIDVYIPDTHTEEPLQYQAYYEDDNLILNPGFETTGANWTLDTGISYSTTQAHTGSQSLVFQAPDSVTVSGYANQTLENPVVGDSYLSIWVYYTPNTEDYINVEIYNATSSSWVTVISNARNTLGNTWKEYTASISNANITQVRIYFHGYYDSVNSAGDTVYVDDIRLYQKHTSIEKTQYSSEYQIQVGQAPEFNISLNYSFPSSGISNRKITLYYPNTWSIINIYNDTSTVSGYTTSSYNTTYNQVEIPESLISVYGTSYTITFNKTLITINSYSLSTDIDSFNIEISSSTPNTTLNIWLLPHDLEGKGYKNYWSQATDSNGNLSISYTNLGNDTYLLRIDLNNRFYYGVINLLNLSNYWITEPTGTTFKLIRGDGGIIQNLTWIDNKKKLDFYASGSVKIYCGEWGIPNRIIVDDAYWNSWSYNYTSYILTINNLASHVEVIWQSSTTDGGGGGGGIISPSEPATPIITPPPTNILPPESGAIILVFIALGSLFYYMEKRRVKNVNKVIRRYFNKPSIDVNKHLRKRWRKK